MLPLTLSLLTSLLFAARKELSLIELEEPHVYISTFAPGRNIS